MLVEMRFSDLGRRSGGEEEAPLAPGAQRELRRSDMEMFVAHV